MESAVDYDKLLESEVKSDFNEESKLLTVEIGKNCKIQNHQQKPQKFASVFVLEDDPFDSDLVPKSYVNGTETQLYKSCTKCDYQTHDKINLTEHLCWKYSCTDCGFLTSRKGVFRNHNNLNGHGKRFKKSIESKLPIVKTFETEKRKQVRFECNMCDFTGAAKTRIIMKHKIDGCFKYKCNECKEFKTSKFKTHIDHNRQLHPNLVDDRHIQTHQDPCHLCPNTKHLLKEHIQKGCSFNGIMYQCNSCIFDSDKSIAIKAHLKTSYSCFRMRCPNCEFKTHNSLAFGRHNCSVDNLFKCQECNFTTNFKVGLSNHNEVAHKGTVHRCSVCDFSSVFRHELAKHMKSQHSISVPHCEICKYITFSESELRKHKVLCNEENLQCKMCDFKPKPKDPRNARIAIKRHVNSFHNLKEKIKCDECHTLFSEERTLRVHKARKHGELQATIKELQCKFCNFKATIKLILDRHIAAFHDGKLVFSYIWYAKRNTENPIRMKHINGRNQIQQQRNEPIVKDRNMMKANHIFNRMAKQNTHHKSILKNGNILLTRDMNEPAKCSKKIMKH